MRFCRFVVGVQLRLGRMADDEGDTLERLEVKEQLSLLEWWPIVAAIMPVLLFCGVCPKEAPPCACLGVCVCGCVGGWVRMCVRVCVIV